jgi:tetratricopeptide (TPR) repeat protein
MHLSSPSFLRLLLVTCAALSCLPVASGEQANQQMQMQSPERPSTLVVSVRKPDGSPMDTPAVVNLNTFSGGSAGLGVFRAGIAEFTNLTPASYTLEIIAAGYERVTQDVQIFTWGERQQISISLVPEGNRSVSSTPGSPILAPKADKEVAKALDALRGNKLEEARSHLEKASQLAPSHPDVTYLWGMYYADAKDFAAAKTYWDKTIQLSPRHVFALAGLAQIAIQNEDYPGAIDLLLRASAAAPSSWHYHEQLAEAYLRQKQYDPARQQAQRALELGKEHAASAQFVLAQAFLQGKDPEAASNALTAYLASHPSGPRFAEARQLLQTLQEPDSKAPERDITSAEITPVAASTVRSALSAVELMPPAGWMPPDVDENMPPIESHAGCPLHEIREQAGKRVGDFVDAVNRIAATEYLDDELVNRDGTPTRHSSRNYSYVASVHQIRPGMYTMEEYRNGGMDVEQFPEQIATLGLTALVMVFHPTYVGDYQLVCEGLSRWHGGLAWQVHFRQRDDKPARLRSYRVNSRSYPIALRGRAWISADTFQIVTLQTDIVAPVPEIRLRAEHIAVEYTPVKFTTRQQELWLPQSAEIYFNYGSRRIHRRHNFRDYMLFAVDEKQQISLPTIEADAGSASPQN